MIGDYADGLPLEVEQNATADELSRWKRREDERYHNPLYQWARKPQNINLLGNEDRWMNIWTQRIIQENENQANEDLKLAKRLLKLLMAEVPASSRPPESTPLVLRNLTTKEYVLEEGLSSHSFNLGHAIVVQAQFTEDPSGLTSIAEHGIWAGHRFDVATLADVDTNEWVDVTDVAIELISMEYDGEEL
ncbi:hypothetical protein PG993_001177 [Apiospora rasikravindrae]|uniref:Uncharacterized protein n=1 Tax=Apiospora rasikravindrae TaxID=990691 RepID=A0ABR1UAP8_9PEZI